MTRILAIDPINPDPTLLDEAGRILCGGGLVAFPTETVYGLGAVATSAEAVARIFEAKGRPSTNPLIVHSDSLDGARACVASWPEVAERLAGHFWPGPLTLVLPRSAIIPDLVTAGRETVGVRVPASLVALGLIRSTGRPLAAPSANRSNRLSPTRAEHVMKDLASRIDLILDAGPTRAGIESTVLDLSNGPPYRILRPGPITAEALSEIGSVEIARAGEILTTDGPASSPGQFPVHYAPRTPAICIEAERLAGFSWPEHAVLVVFGPIDLPDPPDRIAVVHLSEPGPAAAVFYDTLHRLDDNRLDLIAIVPPPDRPEWRALRDRLARATRREDSL